MRTRNILILYGAAVCLLYGTTAAEQNQTDACKQQAIQWVGSHQKMLNEAAMAVWEFAEIGLAEYKSSEYLADMLERQGFKVDRGVAGMPTAFVATFGSGKPVVGILAEYDALPGLSQKGAKSHKEPLNPAGAGQGCGHNLFGAASCGAAMAAKSVMQSRDLSGTVKLFGCPAEETLIGKVYMAKAGLFDGLDVCFTWHPSTENQISLGSSRAMNSFEVIFRGRTAHGAADPWKGRSALDAVELMNIGVNYLREHVKEPVRIHYVIKDGGKAPNIVPDYAKVWYFVRHADRAQVEKLYERVLKCAEGAAIMTETQMEVNLIAGVYEYLPNHTLSELLDKNFRLIGPPWFTEKEQAFAKQIQKNLGIDEEGLNSELKPFEKPKKLKGGSTDVADVSWIVPTAGTLRVAAAPIEAPWHSWVVVSCSASSIGEKATVIAAKVLAASAVEVLTEPTIVEKARAEFNQTTKGFTYKCAVPKNQKPPIPTKEGK